MNPIDAFLALLRLWRDRGAVTFDEDEVGAPHAAVSVFDLDAFGRVAGELRTRAAVVTQTLARLETVGPDVPLSWTGAAATALAGASGRLAVDLAPAAQELARHASTMSAAHEILGEVVEDYRTTMAQATDPLAVGIDVPQARDQLRARLDLAAAAGHAASAAVDDGLAVLHQAWRSPGELILAGDR